MLNVLFRTETITNYKSISVGIKLSHNENKFLLKMITYLFLIILFY